METRAIDIVGNYKPLNTKIICKFIQDVADGTFSNKTEWGLQIRNKIEDIKTPRWVKIISTGPDVPDRIMKGSYALLEQLGWTENFKIGEEKYWLTGFEKILAISETEPTNIV